MRANFTTAAPPNASPRSNMNEVKEDNLSTGVGREV